MRDPLRLVLVLLWLSLVAVPSAAAAQEDQERERHRLPTPEELRQARERARERQPAVEIPERAERVQNAREVERIEPRRRAPATPAITPRGASTAQPDSVIQALRALEGYTVTTYSGSGARFDADRGDVALEGEASLERQGQTITADSMLTFDRESGVVCGYGNPVLSGEGNPVNSDQICYDTERRLGMALGARTEFAQSATWFVHGERVFTVGSDAIYSAGTEFTTCELEIPHYHFHASRFKMINDRILVARDVTLNFGDVPVFWLPFLVQSLRQGRRSGLLNPSFGIGDVVQTSSRHRRQIRNLGVFWAINDYMGTELAMDWRSGDWIALRGRFDYRWTRQFLRGYVNAQQYYEADGTRLMLVTDNGWQAGERTQVRVNGQYASSNEFVQRETFNPDELNRTLQSNASLSHSFSNGASLNFGASRNQQIMAERVTTTLPDLSIRLPALTLAAMNIGGVPQELVWTASTRYQATSEDRDELESPAPTDRDSRRQSATLSSALRFGNLGFSQGITAQDDGLESKPAVTTDTDTTIALPAETTRSLAWNSVLSYEQDLIGTLRVTPQLTLQGRVLDSPLTGNEPITAPVTLGFGTTVKADIFGFWPGLGPFERFRHRISPTVSYSFRGDPDQSALQDSIFGETTRATNAVRIQFQQTFEGKRPAEEAGDSVGDPASDDRALTDEPRRLAGQQPVRLLSITTSAIAYDFEAASRGEEGLTTTQISNSVASDLLKDLSLNFSHSLFRPITDGAGAQVDRTFDLHLEQVGASFGLTGDSWLFRWLDLGGEGEAETVQEAALDTLDTESLLPSTDDRGIVPGEAPSSRMGGINRVGSTGTWRADFNYSLRRPRDETLDQNQMLSARVAFQPTENWSVGWNTGYSISDSEFLNNAVTLTRSLHRWRADFSIVRAQNGNFSFEFEARLSDLPDLRVPYDQRSRGND